MGHFLITMQSSLSVITNENAIDRPSHISMKNTYKSDIRFFICMFAIKFSSVQSSMFSYFWRLEITVINLPTNNWNRFYLVFPLRLCRPVILQHAKYDLSNPESRHSKVLWFEIISIYLMIWSSFRFFQGRIKFIH